MKPLLIVPPAPSRWRGLQELLQHKGLPWLLDIERRVTQELPGAEDVYAVMASGGQYLASACINKRGDVGVLGHVFTRKEHRGRGHARKLTETVLSWFDMTGGKWLFLSTTTEFDPDLYRKFGFEPICRAVWAPHDRVTMLRSGTGVGGDPLAEAGGDMVVRDLTRADWPAMVALLQYRLGPDPRVPLGESAVTAEVFTLDLVAHLEKEVCQLKGAFQGPRLVGLATIATDQPAERTYAMMMPHRDAPPELRQAVLEFARTRGYAQVDFPMEALAPAGSTVAGETSKTA
ncbi:MAG: GNAT family N-acetyltransferase [Phycisphaerae bacterium]|nr:GNAT family N-acetyltransferase [Phycisphaerae bacterium]